MSRIVPQDFHPDKGLVCKRDMFFEGVAYAPGHIFDPLRHAAKPDRIRMLFDSGRLISRSVWEEGGHVAVDHPGTERPDTPPEEPVEALGGTFVDLQEGSPTVEWTPKKQRKPRGRPIVRRKRHARKIEPASA